MIRLVLAAQLWIRTSTADSCADRILYVRTCARWNQTPTTKHDLPRLPACTVCSQAGLIPYKLRCCLSQTNPRSVHSYPHIHTFVNMIWSEERSSLHRAMALVVILPQNNNTQKDHTHTHSSGSFVYMEDIKHFSSLVTSTMSTIKLHSAHTSMHACTHTQLLLPPCYIQSKKMRVWVWLAKAPDQSIGQARLLQVTGWRTVFHFFWVVRACLTFVCTARVKVVLHLKKIPCPRFDKRRPNSHWHGNMQITHNSHGIIKTMIVATHHWRRTS